MRLLMAWLMLTAVCVQLQAKPAVTTGKRYHIVCTLYAGGCLTDGASAKAKTPLYYLPTATTDDATYWLIEEQQDGLYTISNAATNKYITYDGQRTDEADAGITRRYIDMTDTANGGASLWQIEQQENGVYAIRNASQKDHVWDVRAGSYVVGTYSNTTTAASNQRFSIYDENGTMIAEESAPSTPVVAPGIDVTSWIDATAEAEAGWNNGGAWSMAPGGYYYGNNASVAYPFFEKWHATGNGGLPDGTISQTMATLPAGGYTLEADMIAVRQDRWGASLPGTPATGVTLFIANAQTAVSTYSEKPQHYVLTFTLADTQNVELGVKLEATTANWVAIDNLKLTYHGTNSQLITGERAKVEALLNDRLEADEAAAMMANAGSTFTQLEALRKQVAAMPVADPISKGAKNLTIDGHPVVYIESLDLFLCPIPLSQFGRSMTATVNYTKGGNDLVIDARIVPPGTSYTFASIAGGKNFTLSMTTSNGTVVHKPMTFTSLPVVQIEGSFGNNYTDGHITVNTTDGTTAERLEMKAKWRGGITNSGNKHKHNYHVKLKDAAGDKLERSYFGLRNDNSWILEACQVDMSRVRNRVFTDLWNDYSTPPYYIANDARAMTGTRGRFVELTLNGEYRGIYCMTENMDRKQMKLKKIDENTGQYHGQLWKSKDWSYATLMGTRPDGNYQPKDYLSTPNSSSEMWDSYEVKYPDFEDYGNKTDWTTLYNAVNFVATASDDDFRNHVAEYFDLPLVIDYYILMETILATDNHGKNMFFGVYDKQTDKRITFGVWDMDASCGQRWSDDYYHRDDIMNPERDYAEYIAREEHGDYNLFKRLKATNAGNFEQKVRQRYNDLRKGALNTSSILGRFQTYLSEFKANGAAQREYARWSGDSDVAYKTLDFDNEMQYITSWLTRRMNYLDNTRFDINHLGIKGDANGDGETDIADAVAVMNHVLRKTSAAFVETNADANADGQIDIADAVAIVNIILKRTANARAIVIDTKNPD